MPSRSPPTYTASSVSGLSARPQPTNSLGPSPCVPRTAVPTSRRRRRSAGLDRKGKCCRSQPRFRSANSALEGSAQARLPAQGAPRNGRRRRSFALSRGRDACFMSRRPKVRILHRPPLVPGIARRTCQRGTLSHNSGPSARGFKSRSPDQPSRIRDCKYWNSQIYTLGSPGRVRNLHRKTPLERRERQYRQQGTNLQGVDGGS